MIRVKGVWHQNDPGRDAGDELPLDADREAELAPQGDTRGGLSGGR
ncbi:hypothetical protein APR08_000380 [Nocardia amikacinitolerans]|nr:hypothetical protein [Nocardia amikacinitolerans]